MDLASQIERTTEEGLQVEFSQWLTNQSFKGATTVQPESRLEEHRVVRPSATIVWQEVGQEVIWKRHGAKWVWHHPIRLV